jgi:hypothetical protein
MNLRTLFPAARTLSLAGLALTAVLSTGCLFGDDDDDDNGGGNPSALVGIWRHTFVENSVTVEEVTAQLNADGSMTQVDADFEAEICFSIDGTWTADEDSIYTSYTFGSQTETSAVAYNLNGSTLTIHEDGETLVYTRLSEMVDCSDYDFSSPTGWTGTMGATVDGVPFNFGDNVYVEVDSGILGFGGFSGASNLAFALDGTTAGSYTEDNAAATFTPDVSDYLNSYVSTELTLQLTTATATQVAGTFSFSAANISNPMDVVTVTGQFSLMQD